MSLMKFTHQQIYFTITIFETILKIRNKPLPPPTIGTTLCNIIEQLKGYGYCYDWQNVQPQTTIITFEKNILSYYNVQTYLQVKIILDVFALIKYITINNNETVSTLRNQLAGLMKLLRTFLALGPFRNALFKVDGVTKRMKTCVT